MSYTLRPYQEQAVEASLKYLDNSGKKKKHGIIVAPTGAGKSFIIAELARRLNEPVLVLQPSKELLEQNYAKYISYGNPASIYSASMNKREIGKDVTFGTIGTVKSDVEGFIMSGIKFVIIDECHLASKKNSQIDIFLQAVGVNKVIGLTATPLELRNSMEGLAYLWFMTRSRKNFFQDVIHVTQINEIVKLGFWSPIIYNDKDVDTSSLVLNKRESDYTDQSIRDHYQSNKLDQRIKREVARLLSEGRKSVLIFMPSIADAQYLETVIPGCRSVYSGMPTKERREIVDGFKNGSIKVVSNVNILSVGFDHPGLDAIIMARATASFAIYYQQGGRGVRILLGKENIELVDFSGNIERFGKLEEIEFLPNPQGKYDMYNNKLRLTGVIRQPKENVMIDISDTLWFGKHNGKNIVDIETGYLQWMIMKFNFGEKYQKLRDNIFKELENRNFEELEKKLAHIIH